MSIIKARMLINDECEIYFSDGNVIKWNFITGKKRKVISKMKYKRICPTYSEDLRYGIDSLDDAVRLYDITTQTYVDLYNVDGRHPREEYYPMWLTYLADLAGLNHD